VNELPFKPQINSKGSGQLIKWSVLFIYLVKYMFLLMLQGTSGINDSATSSTFS